MIGSMMALAVVTLLVVTAGVMYQLVGARRDARRYPPPGTLIDLGGRSLHVVCAGSGRPMVLFESGIAASSLSWTRVLRDVSDFTSGCAYDRAGLGWSDPSRVSLRFATMLDELRAVLGHGAGAAPAVLVGHSFGALLVCAYASRHPEETAGIVLLDPPSEWQAFTRQQRWRLRGGIHLSRLGGLLARLGVVRACLALLTGGAPGVPRNVARLLGPAASRELEHLVGEVRKLPPDVHPLVQTLWCRPKCFRSMAEHLASLEEAAASVNAIAALPQVPLVVISSADQSAAVIDRHRQLARLSPKGRHVIAARSGHWIQFDEPELVVAIIRETVEGARSPRERGPAGDPDRGRPPAATSRI
jgi:pimeloyl-ACP methyl ester carboxylesterase